MALLKPTREQIIQAFKTEDEGPVVFHNWLKFKPDGGAEAFQTYTEKFNKLMGPKGAKVLYQGNCQMTLIDDVEWDHILIVEYPNLNVWKEMIQCEAYQKIEHHRAEALTDSRLTVTKQVT